VIAAALPEPPVCEGTFYVWVRLPEGLTAERLLLEERVAVAPGEGFGPSGAGWARLSLAATDEAVEAGAERLARAFAAVAA
jgi:aspartate/methionine/tyrosine aminotransferase